ncbi:MAG TPA: CoA pyrophosphatase [Steroidobacteraceae bacterium]|nr:CoA pyrophosphatase [Steroidobacteraceae bacterium]
MALPTNWLARLRHALAAAPNHDPAHWQIAGQSLSAFAGVRAAMPAVPRAAAVLLPILEHRPSPSLLMTTRAGHLRQHAGQISFPGGGIEASDDDVLGAALRETEEEIGIASSFVQPLGFLPDQIVLTGFRITPVVALVRPGYSLRVDHREVAEVFEIPLEYLSHAENFQPTRRVLRGVEITLHDLHFEGRVVWGATAGMLQMLRAALVDS